MTSKRLLSVAGLAMASYMNLNAAELAVIDTNEVINSISDYRACLSDVEKTEQETRRKFEDASKAIEARFQAIQNKGKDGLNEEQKKILEEFQQLMNQYREIENANSEKKRNIYMTSLKLVKEIIEKFRVEKKLGIILESFAVSAYDATYNITPEVSKRVASLKIKEELDRANAKSAAANSKPLTAVAKPATANAKTVAKR